MSSVDDQPIDVDPGTGRKERRLHACVCVHARFPVLTCPSAYTRGLPDVPFLRLVARILSVFSPPRDRGIIRGRVIARHILYGYVSLFIRSIINDAREIVRRDMSTRRTATANDDSCQRDVEAPPPSDRTSRGYRELIVSSSFPS